MISSTNFSGKAFIFFIGLICLIGISAKSESATKNPSLPAEKFTIAVLPVENLSGTSAPLKEIRQLMLTGLKKAGLDILDEGLFNRFMTKYRIRYTGGIDRTMAKNFNEEIGVNAVLITSLELYDKEYLPKVALISRLVSTGDNPVILWIDSIGLAGNDSPGILELGIIKDPHTLLKKASEHLSGSLKRYFSDRKNGFGAKKVSKRLKPKTFYRSSVIASGTKFTVAVAPFFNESMRKNAGEIMMLHFVRELREFDNFTVVEPGIVRESLLKLRVIMDDGVSLANVDIILSRLNAGLILTGKVLDYQDYQGTTDKPKVDFSALAIERKSREIVWSSKSYNEGDEGVLLFDWGKINTAHTMASKMVHSAVRTMVK